MTSPLFHFRLESPIGAGAVAVFRVRFATPDALRTALGFEPPRVHGLGVRRVFDLDEALIATLSPVELLIMPHGGPAIVRAISEVLTSLGGASEQVRPRVADWDSFDRALHDALAIAPSPRAVDLLLDQRERWASAGFPDAAEPVDGVADASVLARLIHPPAVVAIGAPNIGKSSLLNALAGRSLALSFDAPGTTRDAVGALIDVGGLVVRWIDTPGVNNAAGSEHGLARRALDTADLVIECMDMSDPSPVGSGFPEGTPCIRVLTRSDLAGEGGNAPTGGAIPTSAAGGDGLETLAAEIRSVLLPESAVIDPRPWRFWDHLASV